VSFAMGLPEQPVWLHLYNDTTLDNLLEYDVAEPGFCHGQVPTHALIPTDEYLAFLASRRENVDSPREPQ
jgi:hypothetical protein